MSDTEKHKEYLRLRFSPEIPLDAFDKEESDIILKYGSWLNALMRGKIIPFTKEQVHFVGMCNGKVSPKTKIEIIWRRYRLEVLFKNTLKMDKALSNGQGSYAKVRKSMEKIAKMGCENARKWLRKEGVWVDSPSIGFTSTWEKRMNFQNFGKRAYGSIR